jgi:hypothetical protein
MLKTYKWKIVESLARTGRGEEKCIVPLLNYFFYQKSIKNQEFHVVEKL